MCATVLALTGCRVDAELRVRLDGDGSGTVAAAVSLDAEAVARLETNGRTLPDAVRIDGLAEAGWRVTEWDRAPDGSATLTLSHDFAGEDELRARLRELDAGNVVADARIDRARGFLRSHDEVTLELDLRDLRAGIADDEELAVALRSAGLDVAALDDQFDTELQRGLRVRAVVEAPGGKEASAEMAPGETETVSAGRSSFDTDKLVVLMIAGMLAFLAILLYLSASVSARRTRRAEWFDDAPDGRTPLM